MGIRNAAVFLVLLIGLAIGQGVNQEAITTDEQPGYIFDFDDYRRYINLTNDAALVGFWSADYENAIDESGQGNDGTITGATCTPAGRWGGGVAFDGLDADNKIDVGAGESLNISSAITLSGWVKGPLESEQYTIAKPASYYLKFDSDGYPDFGLVIDGAWRISTGTVAIVANEWSYIAGTYDSTTQNLTTYLNGVEINVLELSGLATYNITTALDSVYLGVKPWAAWPAFNGTIDNVRIYDRALSAKEITEIYNSHNIAGFTDSGRRWGLANTNDTTGRNVTTYAITSLSEYSTYNGTSRLPLLWPTDITGSYECAVKVKIPSNAGTENIKAGLSLFGSGSSPDYDLNAWVISPEDNQFKGERIRYSGFPTPVYNISYTINYDTWYYVKIIFVNNAIRAAGISADGDNYTWHEYAQSIDSHTVSPRLIVGRNTAYFDDITIRPIISPGLNLTGQGEIVYANPYNLTASLLTPTGENRTGGYRLAWYVNDTFSFFDNVTDPVASYPFDNGDAKDEHYGLAGVGFDVGGAVNSQWADYSINDEWGQAFNWSDTRTPDTLTIELNNNYGGDNGVSWRVSIRGMSNQADNAVGNILNDTVYATSGTIWVNAAGINTHTINLMPNLSVSMEADVKYFLRFEQVSGALYTLTALNTTNPYAQSLALTGNGAGTNFQAQGSVNNDFVFNLTIGRPVFNDGTPYSGAVWTYYGHTGGAWRFDGVNDYIDIGDSPAFNDLSELSMFAWIKTSSNLEQVILSSFNAANGLTGYGMESKNSIVRVMLSDTDFFQEGTINISTGNWHFVGFTLNSSGNGIMYVDGDSDTTFSHALPKNPAHTMKIGRRGDNVGHWFNGTIDDVRIYDFALSEDEVKRLYYGTYKTPNPSNAGPGLWKAIITASTRDNEYFNLVTQEVNATPATGTDTYTATANETNIEQIQLAITDAYAQDYNATLTYNNTVYTPTEDKSGNTWTFNVSITAPLVQTNNSNISFKWDIVLLKQDNTTHSYDYGTNQQAIRYGYYADSWMAGSYIEQDNYTEAFYITALTANLDAAITFNYTLNGTQYTLIYDSAAGALRTYNTETHTAPETTGIQYIPLGNATVSYDGITRILNSSTTNITVYQILITTCGAPSEAVALNFTIRSEISLEALNGSMDIAVYAQSDNPDWTRNYSFNLTGNSSYQLCIQPAWANYTITDSVIQYWNDDHSARNYYLINALINNITNEIDLYLFPTVNATQIIINIADAAGAAVSDAITTIQRYYIDEDTYRTVAMTRTDYNGRSATYLKQNDVWYKIIVQKDGLIRRTIDRMIITETTLNIPYVDEGEGQEFYTYYNNIAATCTANTSIVVCTATDTTGASQKFQLDVYRIGYNNVGRVLTCTDTETSTSATLSCPVSNNNSYYTLSVIGSHYRLYDGYINTPTATYGVNGVILGAGVVMTMVGIGAFNPVAAIGLGLVGLVLAVLTDIVVMKAAALISLILVGIILIVKMRS